MVNETIVFFYFNQIRNKYGYTVPRSKSQSRIVFLCVNNTGVLKSRGEKHAHMFCNHSHKYSWLLSKGNLQFQVYVDAKNANSKWFNIPISNCWFSACNYHFFLCQYILITDLMSQIDICQTKINIFHQMFCIYLDEHEIKLSQAS